MQFKESIEILLRISINHRIEIACNVSLFAQTVMRVVTNKINDYKAEIEYLESAGFSEWRKVNSNKTYEEFRKETTDRYNELIWELEEVANSRHEILLGIQDALSENELISTAVLEYGKFIEQSISISLFNDYPQTEYPVIALSDQDLALCRSWGSTIDFGKKCNARSAELNCKFYYDSIYGRGTTEDVSGGGAQNSKQYICDLIANGNAIDIKNSSTYSQKHLYSLNYIPFRKQRQAAKYGVTHFGVNTYRDETQYLLGETSKEKILSVLRWISKAYESKITFGWHENIELFDGWLYDFPASHYREKEKAIEAYISYCNKYAHTSRMTTPILYSIYSSMRSSNVLNYEGATIKAVANLKDDGLLSRPALYLLCLCEFLETLRISPNEVIGRMTVIQEILFSNEAKCTRKNRPILLDDPNHYIFNFLEFAKNSHLKRTAISRGFERFIVKQPNLVIGETKDGAQITVIGYCGQCGRSGRIVNLFYGENPTCKECGRLKCKDGHCSLSCRSNKNV